MFYLYTPEDQVKEDFDGKGIKTFVVGTHLLPL